MDLLALAVSLHGAARERAAGFCSSTFIELLGLAGDPSQSC
jgi:hypothetical protein